MPLQTYNQYFPKPQRSVDFIRNLATLPEDIRKAHLTNALLAEQIPAARARTKWTEAATKTSQARGEAIRSGMTSDELSAAQGLFNQYVGALDTSDPKSFANQFLSTVPQFGKQLLQLFGDRSAPGNLLLSKMKQDVESGPEGAERVRRMLDVYKKTILGKVPPEWRPTTMEEARQEASWNRPAVEIYGAPYVQPETGAVVQRGSRGGYKVVATPRQKEEKAIKLDDLAFAQEAVGEIDKALQGDSQGILQEIWQKIWSGKKKPVSRDDLLRERQRYQRLIDRYFQQRGVQQNALAQPGQAAQQTIQPGQAAQQAPEPVQAGPQQVPPEILRQLRPGYQTPVRFPDGTVRMLTIGKDGQVIDMGPQGGG